MLHTGDQVTVTLTDPQGNDLPTQVGTIAHIDRASDAFVIDLADEQITVSRDALVA